MGIIKIFFGFLVFVSCSKVCYTQISISKVFNNKTYDNLQLDYLPYVSKVDSHEFLIGSSFNKKVGSAFRSGAGVLSINGYLETNWTKRVAHNATSSWAYLTEIISNREAFHFVERSSQGKSVISKVDLSGNMLWRKQSNLKMYYDLDILDDSSLVLLGQENALPERAAIEKVDADGNLLWRKAYEAGGDNYYRQSLCLLKEQSVLVAGRNDNDELIVLKIDSIGNLIWAKLYRDLYVRAVSEIMQTKDSSYVMIGHNQWADEPADYSIFVMKIDQEGDVVWNKSIDSDSTLSDRGNAIVELGDENMLLCGNTQIKESSGWSAKGCIIKMGSRDGGIKGALIVEGAFSLYDIEKINDSSIITVGKSSYFNGTTYGVKTTAHRVDYNNFDIGCNLQHDMRETILAPFVVDITANIVVEDPTDSHVDITFLEETLDYQDSCICVTTETQGGIVNRPILDTTSLCFEDNLFSLSLEAKMDTVEMQVDFGDGEVEAYKRYGKFEINHRYQNTGTYGLKIIYKVNPTYRCTDRYADTIPIVVDVKDFYFNVNLSCDSNKIEIQEDQYDNVWFDEDSTKQIDISEIDYLDSVSVRVFHNSCWKQKTIQNTCEQPTQSMSVFLPNAFRVGSRLKPIISGEYEYFSLNIYDRFGKHMFQANNPFEYWDGAYNNQFLPPSVVSFNLVLQNIEGKEIIYSGNIQLLN